MPLKRQAGMPVLPADPRQTKMSVPLISSVAAHGGAQTPRQEPRPRNRGGAMADFRQWTAADQVVLVS